MKTTKSALAAALVLAMAAPLAVQARGDYHGKHEYDRHFHPRQWHGGHHYHYYHRYGHQGHWRAGHHRGHAGYWWVVGNRWHFYPKIVHPFPNVGLAATIVIR